MKESLETFCSSLGSLGGVKEHPDISRPILGCLGVGLGTLLSPEVLPMSPSAILPPELCWAGTEGLTEAGGVLGSLRGC